MGVFGEPPWDAGGTYLAGEGWGRPPSCLGLCPWANPGSSEGHFWNASPFLGLGFWWQGPVLQPKGPGPTWAPMGFWDFQGWIWVFVLESNPPQPGCPALGWGWAGSRTPWVVRGGGGGGGGPPTLVKGCEVGGRVSLGDPRKQWCGCCLSIRQPRLSVLVRESGHCIEMIDLWSPWRVIFYRTRIWWQMFVFPTLLVWRPGVTFLMAEPGLCRLSTLRLHGVSTAFTAERRACFLSVLWDVITSTCESGSLQPGCTSGGLPEGSFTKDPPKTVSCFLWLGSSLLVPEFTVSCSRLGFLF